MLLEELKELLDDTNISSYFSNNSENSNDAVGNLTDEGGDINMTEIENELNNGVNETYDSVNTTLVSNETDISEEIFNQTIDEMLLINDTIYEDLNASNTTKSSDTQKRDDDDDDKNVFRKLFSWFGF